MSKTKHTPGPWEAAGCVVYAIDGDLVADLSLNGRRHPDVTEANTRLSAAAPDLKQALYDILHADSDNQIPDKLFKAAKAALDKSEGIS